MSEMNNIMSDDEIFSKVCVLMDKLKTNQQLHDLAERQGIDVQNSVKLTDATIENVAVSVVSLLLAKRNNDDRYSRLVANGIQKRSLKTDIVNTYKNQAMQLIERYKNKNE